MPDLPKIVDSITVAKSRMFHIQRRSLAFSNGVQADFERLVSSYQGAVMIIPMLDDDTVLLIREYAAGVHRYELGLPKGKIENGEDVLEAANREIMEEVGYGANVLKQLDPMTIAPSYLGHTTQVVLASDLYPQKLTGDEPEEIQVVPWKLSQLPELLQQPDLTEARTIAALFIARELQENI